MAIRNIVQIGDDVLRKKCFAVTDFGPKTAELIDDMKETYETVSQDVQERKAKTAERRRMARNENTKFRFIFNNFIFLFSSKQCNNT